MLGLCFRLKETFLCRKYEYLSATEALSLLEGPETCGPVSVLDLAR